MNKRLFFSNVENKFERDENYDFLVSAFSSIIRTYFLGKPQKSSFLVARH